MSEALTLIQTGKLYDFPIILMGTESTNKFDHDPKESESFFRARMPAREKRNLAT